MSVYFAQAGRYTKIGHSANPLDRVSTVTTNGTRPDDLLRGTDAHLIGWIPGDMRREGVMHSRFAEQRVAGEWFVLDVEEVRNLIWADPQGVDVDRMSAAAVLAAFAHPNATRDDIAAAGIRLEAASMDEFCASPLFGGAS